MKYYYLNKFITIRKNDINLILSGGKEDLFIECNDEIVENLKKLSTDGLLKNDFYTQSFFNNLIRNNYITQSKISPHNSRNFLFLEYLNVELNIPEIEKNKILVLGAGGGGGTLIYLLAQFGFKNLFCIDYDDVEVSDILKTQVYRKNDIGKSKVEALNEILNENFNCDLIYRKEKVSNYEHLKLILKDYSPDLIINAIDPSPIHKLKMNELVLKLKIPILFIAYSYEVLITGPLIVPSKTSCYESYSNYIKYSTNNLIDFSRINKMEELGLIHPSTSFNINILASLALKDCIMFLIGKHEFVTTLNKIIFTDILKFETSFFELECLEDCICNN